ncbi:unnamed protein product [Rhizopus stolonifer]
MNDKRKQVFKMYTEIYIGNLANVIEEYIIVKLFEPFGKITFIDSLLYCSGPKKGLPRGYCFLEYETREQALKAISKLNGKKIKGRPLMVSFAHMATIKDDKRNPYLLSRQKSMQKASCTDAKIKAIEQRLQILKNKGSAVKETKTHRYKPY